MNAEQSLAVLIEIVSVIFIGIISAMWTRFFSFLIGNPVNKNVSNNILSFYGRWILRKYFEAEMKQSEYNLNWWKAAGVCPYCVNVYFTSAISILAISFLSIHWWWVFLIMAISHWFLSYIYDRQG